MARRRRIRRWLTGGLLLALVGGGIFTAYQVMQRSDAVITESCTAKVGSESYSLALDQTANASLISAIAVRRSLPARAASIALATSLQESKLRNIDYGDTAGPDSRGLFQQRPSQGWGTEAQVMDPVYATNAFYDVLIKVEGYESLPITEAAQKVQRSAFPDAYADHEPEGRAFASALTGQSGAGLDCVLRPADANDGPGAVSTEMYAAFGAQDGTVNGATLSVPAAGAQGWAVANWAVANAKSLGITRVSFGGQAWDRQARNGWQAADSSQSAVQISTYAPTVSSTP
ncbi:hypothetical protein ACQR35_02865 [Pseudarthrobacter sp. J1738]|uniref:hypothetical protein n=1 Tax=Pseudarthrobacter sp. J1738 TaxID=3420446 RepID=UPI003D28C3EB